MNNIDILETGRCRLLPPTYENIHSLYLLFNDETVKRFLPDFCKLFENEEVTKRTIKSLVSNIRKGYGLFWCINTKEDLIGFIGIADLQHFPSVFFALFEKYRRNGYMEECILAIQEHVSEKYGCKQIYTEVDSENERSLHVLARCGYVKDKNLYVYTHVSNET